MITETEQQQLDRLKAEEADIYAQIMFLMFVRLMPTIAADKIADVVLGAYADLNQQILEGQ
jgi:hypothetical protein